MTKLGMDADVIARISTQLDAQVTNLEHVVTGIDSLVSRMQQNWYGNDSRQFEGWWLEKHRPALDRAIQSIRGLASSAKNNVSEQQRVSSASGSSGAPSPSVGPASGHAAPAPPATHSPNGHSQAAVSAAIADDGKRYSVTNPDGSTSGAPGQCFVRVADWVKAGGGTLSGGAGPIQAFQNSHAMQVPLDQVQPGDVLQRVSTNMATPDTSNWGDPQEHTLMVTGVNSDGTLHIAQGNVDYNGLVDTENNWSASAHTPSGSEWIAYRLPGL